MMYGMVTSIVIGAEVFERVVAELRKQERRDRDRAGSGDEQRIAVRRGLRDVLGADSAGRARAVVDHDLLAQVFGEFLADRARGKVDAAAGGERHHDAHGFVGIVLRAGRECVCKAQDRDEEFYHGE